MSLDNIDIGKRFINKKVIEAINILKKAVIGSMKPSNLNLKL